MLVLSRHRNESIIVGHDVQITVVDVRGDKVRLGIVAPERPIHRHEAYKAIMKKAAAAVADAINTDGGEGWTAAKVLEYADSDPQFFAKVLEEMELTEGFNRECAKT